VTYDGTALLLGTVAGLDAVVVGAAGSPAPGPYPPAASLVLGGAGFPGTTVPGAAFVGVGLAPAPPPPPPPPPIADVPGTAGADPTGAFG